MTTRQTFALLYLFIPAFIANGAPIVAAQIPLLSRWTMPVFEPVFGKNKTWRGLLIGVGAAVGSGMLQYLLRDIRPFAVLTTYQSAVHSALVVSVLLGSGALAGDLVKSAAKRIVGKPPGSSWIPWDAVDYMIGAMVFLWPVMLPHPAGILLLLVIGPLLSRIANGISYLIGWKKVWY